MSEGRQSRRFCCIVAVLSLTIVLFVMLSSTVRPHLLHADSGSAATEPNTAQSSAEVRRRPAVKFMGWIREVTPAYWLIGDYRLYIDSASVTASNARTGMYAVATARVDDLGQLHAETISMQPPQSPLSRPIEFRGIIQEIEEDYWVVSERLVFINRGYTSIQGHGEIGALAQVKGTLMLSDVVLAKSIKVIVSESYEFEGIIESMSEDAWVVNGVTVTISPVTTIQGTPAVGLTAEVQGVLQPDGSVLAEQILVRAPQIDLQGLVESIEDTYWIIGGKTVCVDAQTFIDDSRAPAEVGAWAQVRALRRQDGSLRALRIRLSRPSS